MPGIIVRADAFCALGAETAYAYRRDALASRVDLRRHPAIPAREGNDRHPRTSHCTLALRQVWEYSFHAVALKQLQLIVRGRVQGVYFRASTQREARRLGLSGWVKNRPDGTVEVLVEGEETSIRELYSWAQKGPGAARVERVDARWRSFTGEFPDFRITE